MPTSPSSTPLGTGAGSDEHAAAPASVRTGETPSRYETIDPTLEELPISPSVLLGYVDRDGRPVGSEPGVGAPTEPAVRPDPAIPRKVIAHEEQLAAEHNADPTPVEQLRARGRRVWVRVLQVGLILFTLAVAYYLVSLFQVWSTGRAEQADPTKPVDAIVVMGAAQYDGRPSPQLAARLDHVVELWPDDVAPLVVVTGGNLPGDRFTEAEASAAYLVDRGIPEDVILLENDGSNSFESLESVAAILEARSLDEVLIVTDPYHALRSRLIAEEVGLDATVSSTDTSVVSGSENLRRHLQEAGGVAVGRIIGFERLTSLTG